MKPRPIMHTWNRVAKHLELAKLALAAEEEEKRNRIPRIFNH